MNKCQHCGKMYQALKVTSKFCSVECRVAAHRAAKKTTKPHFKKEKLESMAMLLKVKIERYEEDIEALQQNCDMASIEETKKVYRDMIRERKATLSELQALWDDLQGES